MGVEIPVFFAAVDPDRLPATLETWFDGVPLLDELLANRDTSGVRDFTSRNWWQLYIFDGICAEMGIKSVSFHEREVLTLSNPELISLQSTLTRLVEKQSAIPKLRFSHDNGLGRFFLIRNTRVHLMRHDLLTVYLPIALVINRQWTSGVLSKHYKKLSTKP